MILTNWLRPRKTEKAPQTRTRLGVQQLESRDVPSWVGQIGGAGAGSQAVGRQAMDALGNSYVSGNFYGTVDFDMRAGVATRTSPSAGDDAFAASYSADGTLRWARQFGGTGRDLALSSALNTTGDELFVCGQFEGNADFTGDGVADATSAGGTDGFIVRLSARTGETVWFKTFGNASNGTPVDIAVADGFVYTTGFFLGTADFDPGAGVFNLSQTAGKGKSSGSDAFVQKLTTDGNFVTAWRFGSSTGSDEGRSLRVVGGAVHVLGYFNGTADFDPGAGTTTLTSAGYSDVFFARYTTTGSLVWANRLGNASWDGDAGIGYWALAGDADGLHLTGRIEGAFDADPGRGVVPLTGSTAGTAFVGKYSAADGSLVWARTYETGVKNASAVPALVDPGTGDVYVGSGFYGSIDLNPAAPGGELVSAGSGDGYLLKLDAAGNYRNAWRMGGVNSDSRPQPYGIFRGTVYAAGFIGSPTASFPTGDTLTRQGSGYEAFVMALDQFSASPAAAGSPFTLTASNFVDTNPLTTTTEMAFYADSNNDGVLDPLTDTLLGYGTQTAAGTWAITIAFPTAGTYKLFAQARDNFGTLSNPLALDLQVL